MTKRQKTGKPFIEDEADVAAAAVEDAARDAARLERCHRELAEMRRDVLVAGVHGDVALRDVAEHREHLADRPVVRRASRFEAGPPFTV